MVISMAGEKAGGSSARRPWATSVTRRCSISVRDRSGIGTAAGAAQADLDQGHGQRQGEMEDDPAAGGDDGGAGEEGGVGEGVHVLLPALLLELADIDLDRRSAGWLVRDPAMRWVMTSRIGWSRRSRARSSASRRWKS